MSNIAPLKHVSTEPAPLATKRDRRRGATGRAAALRRAPSDSDCSGETASLSADSGDRKPAPLAKAKSRSRRRGSEWEVLEGLKDGQRFERRPEVFNGYLHKKRKWPLKGWHKRFFVIDGGILVYARSPTDVARGRLHGSVDVGLSVISAKARRRRIDIDADEFIYHLRAKTADVFRTWLNVLKAHRLYRQHLLTFGARESMPKVNAPDDLPLPPTDSSSRSDSAVSLSSTEVSLQDSMSCESQDLSKFQLSKSLHSSNLLLSKMSKCNYLSNCRNVSKNSDLTNTSNIHGSERYDWRTVDDSKSLESHYLNSVNSNMLLSKISKCNYLSNCRNVSKNSDLTKTSNIHKSERYDWRTVDDSKSLESHYLNSVNLRMSHISFIPAPINSFPILSPQNETTNLRDDSLWIKAKDESDKSELLPFRFDPFDDIALQNHSLCSMNCVTKRFEKEFEKYKKLVTKYDENDVSERLDHDEAMDKVDPILQPESQGDSTYLYQCSIHSPNCPLMEKISPFKSPFKKRRSMFINNYTESTTMYFTTNKKKKTHHCPDTNMKRSRKCMNLVKYRNKKTEPSLKSPSALKSMILGRNKKASKVVISQKLIGTHELETKKEDKMIQDKMTVSEYDCISEQLLMTIFNNFSGQESYNKEDLKLYLVDIIQEIYNNKADDYNIMKVLFKNLLQYWLQNTSIKSYQSVIMKQRSINKPSNDFFTRDESISGLTIDQMAVETQCGRLSKSNTVQIFKPQVDESSSVMINPKAKENISKQSKPIKLNASVKKSKPIKINMCTGESFEKDEEIQELEKLLKSTVYICETFRKCKKRDKDIEITKKLISKLENNSKDWEDNTSSDKAENSNSSTEYPKLQNTLQHLISETSMNAEIAKEFLGAYLNVLRSTSDDRTTESSSSKPEQDSEQSTKSPKCTIQTEAKEKQISRSVTTIKIAKYNKPRPAETNTTDPGQLYLKHVLDKITTIFIKPMKIDASLQSTTKANPIKTINTKIDNKNKIYDPFKGFPKKNLVHKNPYNKSVMINLSQYNMEGISMLSHPTLKNVATITINVKEKPPNANESDVNNLNLKFAKLNQCSFGSNFDHSNFQSDSYSTKRFKTSIEPKISFKNPYSDFNPGLRNEVSIKPGTPNSDATSRAYFQTVENEYSVDSSFKKYYLNDDVPYPKNSDESEDGQPCYMVSNIKKNVSSALQSKTHTKVQQSGNISSTKVQQLGNKLSKSPIKPVLAMHQNSANTVVDEQFILLLLDNLTLLSKSIPTMNRDISALYMKLKKRHDKVKKKNIQTHGLGLLGQIYSDDISLSNCTHTSMSDKYKETKSIFTRQTAQTSVDTDNQTCSKKFIDNCTGDYYVTEFKEDFVQTDKTSTRISKKPKELVDKECECKLLKSSHLLSCSNMSHLYLKNELSEAKSPELLKKDGRKTKERLRSKTCPEKGRQSKQIKNDMGDLRNMFIPFVNKRTVSRTENNVHTIEISLSAQDWPHKTPTKECAVSTAKHINKDEVNAPKIDNKTFCIPPLTVTKPKQTNYIPPISLSNTKKLKVVKIKALMEELKSLSSVVKLSAQAQLEDNKKPKYLNETVKAHIEECKKQRKEKIKAQIEEVKKAREDNEKIVMRDLVNQKEREFGVYQLFLGKSMSHSSVTDSNQDIWERSDDLKTIYRCSSDPSFASGLISPTSPPIRGPQAGFVSGTPGGRLASWIVESGGPLETVSRELGQAQLSVQQLQRLLDALELQHVQHHDTDVSLEGASPNVKKDRRKFGLRKKKSNSKCASIELAPPLQIDPSSSHTALSASTAPPSPGGGASSVPNSASSLPIACTAVRPQSLGSTTALGQPGPSSLTSLTPDQQLREDFTVLAKDLVHSLKGVISTLVCERGRLRAAMESNETTTTSPRGMVAALRTNLNTALQQNSELRSRLSRIHDASDLAEMSSVNNSEQVARPFHQSLSFSSSCVSASEFFDAEEHEEDMKTAEILAGDEAGVIELDGDSSSEAGSLASVGSRSSQGSEASASSDNSEGALLSAEPSNPQNGEKGPFWSRRTRLPSPRPNPGGPSLWNLLYKNIGKDLSQISMPVTINEPLNMLQRLCEELEYSELLDAAAECQHPVERCALIAAFAVSAYSASAHRAASKPFNPLLHETYECVRDDRRLRFISEQVSHHPPVSACHAESPKWCFWQEARIKTKFWGKSMEFQPAGRVHVRLNTTGDHYSWNKVTTCVHNLFGGQRWVDQYGDMTITCHGTDISCKLNFVKASSWSSSRHEVRGSVTGGGTRLRLQGRWSEALFAGEPPANRCLWRPGAMPPDYELYYGFTRFAMELNEMEPGLREILPPTDTRLRPDQRALEQGDVDAAEQYKLQLEQAQRDRRRDSNDQSAVWFRKTLEDGQEMWVFGGDYWKAREAGFAGHTLPRIW